MRPEILYPLFASVSSLKGVGARLAGLLAKAAGDRIVDLLWHLPTGFIDRHATPRIADAVPGTVATLRLKVEAHEPSRTRRAPYRVWCSDESGQIALVFFHARADYLTSRLPVGTTRLVSGRVETYGEWLQMPHPDYIVADESALPAVEPVYPLTTGLTPKPLHTAIRQALDRAPELPEWIDPDHRARERWPSWRDALIRVHTPDSEQDLDSAHPARRRIAFDELLANQLALGLVRTRVRRRAGRSLAGTGELTKSILARLPYRLTGSQEQALTEIFADIADSRRMLRLLQGDVGSGKTIVALLAMATAVEAGAQATLMAPTEILARQHFAAITGLLQGSGVRVALLSGRDRGRSRDKTLKALAEGEVDILVGTHAVFQEDVAFSDLAFAVIDEQHRFGVHQRLNLGQKGRSVDVLIMTATPIPRTLTLTAYGDIDVSRLTDRPPGRKPIRTAAVPVSRTGEVVAAVRRALDSGTKVYWVCPLVGTPETADADVAAAEARYAALREIFGDRVGLVHGRMPGAERDRVMHGFTRESVDILVATTVIEVGVDVPEASVMVIEHAERFGLAQLHQLRGRVGRGERESSCLLLYAPPLGEVARQRIKVLRDTDDGFRIAEEDLKLRGAGELLGTRQSGFASFRLADPVVHGDLLLAARDDARLILERDPDLKGPRSEALRVLLYLFERDAAIRYLLSG